MLFVLRNLTCLRRCSKALKYQNYSSHCLSEESITNSVNKKLENDTAPLFDYIVKNQECLTSQNCIEVLKKLSRHSIIDFSSSDAIEKKNILIVCDNLDKQIANVNLSEAIEALGLLNELKMPSTSVICESLLKKIKREICYLTNINDIDVVKLQRLLSKTNSNLAISIKKDLIIVIEAANKEAFDINLMCSKLFEAVHSKHVNMELIASILHKISKYPKEISALTTSSIYLSCMKFPEILIAEKINIRKLENNIIQGAKQLSYGHIRKIFYRLSMLSAQNKLHDDLYNSEFVDSLIAAQLLNNISFENGILLLHSLQLIGHTQTNLTDYLMIKCFENQFLILKLSSINLIKFTRGLSLSPEKPLLWDSIKHVIVRHKQCKNIMVPLAYNLALLNFFHHPLISSTFEKTESQYEVLYNYTKDNILSLYQMVKTLDPNYTGPWPSTSLLKLILQQKNVINHCEVNDNILSTLEKALGGCEYVQSNVQTKYRHFINHIVVMRKGGFPVAINHNDNKRVSSYVEDIAPPDSQIIAILYFDNDNYLRNVNKLRKEYILYIKSLEALGYSVLPLYLQDWTSMNQKDKIPFIMNEIKSRYSDEI